MSENDLVPLSAAWDSEWRFETNGQFEGWADRRGLYTIRHTFGESKTGDMAQLVREVTVPSNWQGPLILSFFATDNHHGEHYDPSDWAHYVGADIFWGHRFRQVLVNDQLVWDRDVAESDSPYWQRWRQQGGLPYQHFHHHVDISDLAQPGERFRLTLRILDKVGSGHALPQDVHQAHYWEPADFDRTTANHCFDFMAWWGDVYLATPTGLQDAQPTVYQGIALKPQPAPAKTTETATVSLPIVHADLLPDIPYPLWGGVPFPRGLVCDERDIRIRNEQGQEIPCQVQVCSRWPDSESIQWAWLNVQAAPGQQSLSMECGSDAVRARPSSPLQIRRELGGAVTIETGALTLTTGEPGQAALLQTLQVVDRPACGPVVGVLNQQMLGSLRRHTAHCQEVVIEEWGPVRAAVLLSGGLLDEDGHRFGRFTARLWAWADSPLLSASFRVFQETDQLVAIVDDLLIEIATPYGEDTRGGFSPQTFDYPLPEGQVRELELRALQPDAYEITGKRNAVLERGEHAPGWVDQRGVTADGVTGGLACGVRWFWQQNPKTLTVTPAGIIVGLFQRRKRDDWDLDSPLYMMTRGEAKRHQLWLWPHDGTIPAETLAQVQRAWDARPHLFNAQWAADSQVLGHFALHGPDHLAEMDRHLQRWDESELGEVRYGIRDFRETLWCQNYRGRAANGLLTYWSSRRQAWQAYFEQVMAHNLDIDTIHYEPDRPHWVGAIRSYSPYHTTGDASHGINSNCQDQFLHYFFVGEPDSWAEALRAADHIAQLAGDQGRSARQEGWPLAQMSLAYLWTGKESYLHAAQGFCDYAYRYTHPRRGAYDEVHSSFSHRGIVPFMTGYLGFGLIRYHQATGDERAAKLLIALAQATVSETSDGNGGFWYSPCPSQRMWGHTAWSALIGGMLAYAFRLTDDRWFADQAARCYERIATDGGPSLDMAPLLGEMLAGIELARNGDIT